MHLFTTVNMIHQKRGNIGVDHCIFNHYKFVSYGRQSLPHSSGDSQETRLSPDECGRLCLPYETNL